MSILFSIYAVLMLVGGYMGYAKAGSKMSLIMGIVSSIVIFAGVYVMRTNLQTGYTIIAVMSGLLTGTFLMRLIKTKAMMPSGMLFVLSLVIFIISILPLLKK